MLDEKLTKLGLQIDNALDNLDRKTLEQSLIECELLIEETDSYNRSILYFYKANCYAVIRAIEKQFQDDTWDWYQEKRVLEILNLRQAVKEDAFEQLGNLMKCKILTNLANNLRVLGRAVEAITYYDKVLLLIDNFAMAIGNKSIGLFDYGKHLYDDNYQLLFFSHAYKELGRFGTEPLLWDSGFDHNAKEYFQQYENYIGNLLKDHDLDNNCKPDNVSLGRSKKEQNYRKWCLKHKLFLNPLNDLIQNNTVAIDNLHLPDHVYKITEDIRFPKYFNILKQEFVTARYMLYEFETGKFDHFSDNGVVLENCLDGVWFGYRNEVLKNSLRVSYSIFDKIALFLNDYMNIGLSVESLNFRKIWGKYKNKELELFPCFTNNENLPLRGLYFLSKDLYSPNFKDVAEPEARELNDIRNMAEHRYLEMQEYVNNVDDTDYIKYITIDDLHSKALKMLSLAREGLIYLSLAMHVEEGRRDDERSDKLMVTIQSEPL